MTADPSHEPPRTTLSDRIEARAVVDQPLVAWPLGYVLDVLSRIEDAVTGRRRDHDRSPSQPTGSTEGIDVVQVLRTLERYLEELDTDLVLLLDPHGASAPGARAESVDRGHDAVVDWPVLIAHHARARRHQEAAWPYDEGFALPSPGAPEEAIAAVEERWGPLEATYRSFLAHADGWVGFLDGGDLLSTGALLDPAAREVVARYLEEHEVEPDELAASEVLPLTTEIRHDDLVMLRRAGARSPGQVVCWGHHGDDGRYPDFASYVASCTLRAGFSSELQGVPRATVRENIAGDLGAQRDTARKIAAEPQAPWPADVVVQCLATLQAALSARRPDDPRAGLPARGGATPQRLDEVRTSHGMPRYSQHLDLLRLVDGWEHVIGVVDLLSTTRLLDTETLGPLRARARTALAAQGLDLDGFSLVASSADGEDTVVLSRSNPPYVLWLRDQLTEAVYGSVDRWLVDVLVAHLATLDDASGS